MNIINLRTFIIVSRTGGFHSAADQLNITQAAVSARIKALEDQIGQRLLDRGRNGATLTLAGQQLLPDAQSITRTWDHATSMLGVPEARAVTIRIGAQFSIWAQLVLDWAARIAETIPETKIELDFDLNSDMLKSVQEGRLDLAITHAVAPLPGLHILSLPEETMVLVANRPATLGEERMPPFVHMDWGPQFMAQLARIEPRLPEGRVSVGSGLMGMRFIQENEACGYLPLRTARWLLNQNRLYRVKRAPKFSIAGHVIYSEENPNHLFLERAIDSFRDVHKTRSEKAPY